LDADFTRRFGDLKGDPVVPIWNKIAHQLDLSEAQHNTVISQLYSEMDKAGLLPSRIDPMAELGKLMPASGDAATRETAAKARVNEAVAWMKTGLERKDFSQGTVRELTKLVETADGIQALEQVMKLGRESGIRSGGQPPSGAPTKGALESQMKDPRYDSGSAKYDSAFRADVDAKWRALHGATG
jgi:hypothetical protein